MASTYTTGFGIEKIGSGEQSGTWGTTTNHNLDIIDRIASYKAVAITTNADTATLTVREASPGSGTENLQDGMYRVIKFTGALDSNCTVTIAPNTAPAYFIIENATTDSGSSGPYSIILSQGSGANVTVQNGKNVIVYCDGAGSGAAVVDALADLQIGTLEATGAAAIDGALTVTGASQFNSTITAGVDDTGYDVKFFGDTASRYWLWDTSADGVVQRGTLTVGVDDTGHDVKFFGATSGQYMLWDESADTLFVTGEIDAGSLDVSGQIDVDGVSYLDAVVVDGTVTVGVDDTGYDVKFFGDTASRYWLWDTSADGVVQRGTLTVGVDDTGHDVKFFGATSGRYMEWDESQDVLRLSDNVQLQLGTGGDLILYHAPEHSYIQEGGSGNLYIQGTNLYLQGRATGETMLGAVENGAVELYYDASKKIETTTDGVRLSDASSVDISTPLLSGADHTCTGLTAQMLAGGTISAFDLVCVHTTTGEVVEADASAYATARVIGIAPAAISDTATGTILLQGFIRDDSWSWTTGSTLYLSETAGAMTHTPPSTDGAFVNVVGVALEPDVVYINPSMDVIERA